MLILLWIQFVICSRLLRLKSKENMYATNANGNLILQSPRLPTLSNQHVVIHNRALYFFNDGVYYTLAMAQGGLEIKLIAYNAIEDRGIQFLLSAPDSQTDQRKKKINPFEYLSQSKSKDERRSRTENHTYDDQHKMRSMNDKIVHRQLSHRYVDSHIVKERPDSERAYIAKATIEKQKQVNHNGIDTNTSHVDVMIKNDSIATDKDEEDVSEVTKTDVEFSNEIRGTTKVDADIAEYLSGESSSKQKRYGSSRIIEHLVESDSKMDYHDFGYVIKNVNVKEIDGEGSFLLIGNNNSCVTYYKGSFIFMPCSSSTDQIFKLEPAEDVLKKKAISSFDQYDYQGKNEIENEHNHGHYSVIEKEQGAGHHGSSYGKVFSRKAFVHGDYGLYADEPSAKESPKSSHSVWHDHEYESISKAKPYKYLDDDLKKRMMNKAKANIKMENVKVNEGKIDGKRFLEDKANSEKMNENTESKKHTTDHMIIRDEFIPDVEKKARSRLEGDVMGRFRKLLAGDLDDGI
ncbi:hypothetical protein OCOL_000737 [Ordospora colligata]|uniref:Uncharacterized protein n=1 Tax=Ordospora colligata OC4 TaxID=1354746 RepID=A0A0B2UKB5_9MICR|nr:uncharacterized protein M896_070600 [Ordospora colligata OC4]KHN69492.1 hypothetical protein M896_070600 [Ordospora colligata OC4]